MDVRLKRMPFGGYVGAVTLAVTVDPAEAREAREELPTLLASRLTAAPGAASIFLESVPWNAPWWPEVLWSAMAHPAVAQHGRAWVGVHPLDEPTWVAGDIEWVMDASYLLAEPVTLDDLVAALERVPPFPRVDDLVVRPHRANIGPALLDVVHGFVRALRPGQLLLPPAEVDDAVLSAVARCESSWVVVTT